MKHGGAHAPGAPPVPTPMRGIIIVMKSLSDVVNDSEDCSGELSKAISTPITVSQSTNHGVGNILHSNHMHYHHSLLYVELNKVNGGVFIS